MELQTPNSYEYQGVLYVDPGFPISSIEGCRKLGLTTGDILIASYPKAGTTWMQEIVYLIKNGADIEKAKTLRIGQRVMHVEQALPNTEPNINVLMRMSSSRYMFTHLHTRYFKQDIMEGKVKVIVILRNPKDNLVSYYHFLCINKAIAFPGSWDDFFECVKSKAIVYGDYFDWVLDWWKMKKQKNVYIVRYEDLKKNRLAEIRKIAEFLEEDLTEVQLLTIYDATSFNVMKGNPSTNQAGVPAFNTDRGSFMRKGEIGDWKNYFNPQQSYYIDMKVEKMLEEHDITFDFE